MTDIIMVAIPILIVALFIIFIRRLWKMKQDKKAGFVVKDERTTNIEGRAAYLTVHGTGYFMLGLIWYRFANDAFGLGLPDVGTNMALAISVLFNSLLYIGLISYFQKKRIRLKRRGA